MVFTVTSQYQFKIKPIKILKVAWVEKGGIAENMLLYMKRKSAMVCDDIEVCVLWVLLDIVVITINIPSSRNAWRIVWTACIFVDQSRVYAAAWHHAENTEERWRHRIPKTPKMSIQRFHCIHISDSWRQGDTLINFTFLTCSDTWRTRNAAYLLTQRETNPCHRCGACLAVCKCPVASARSAVIPCRAAAASWQ